MSDFRFKEFAVKHDRSAMKVGTDGVLLGAWADLPSSGTVLDVGCGCGLIALMTAQRLSAGSGAFRITGIDVDEGSIADAVGNFAASPWGDRLQAVQADFLSYAASLPADSVDAVLSNPPYFSEDLLSPHARRNLSRHAESLPFGELLRQVQRLLRPGGSLAMVLPPRAYAQIEGLLPETAPQLCLQRLTRVYFKEGKDCGRLLAQWRKLSDVTLSDGQAGFPQVPCESSLILQDPQGNYTSAYCSLVRPFYTWLTSN